MRAKQGEGQPCSAGTDEAKQAAVLVLAAMVAVHALGVAAEQEGAALGDERQYISSAPGFRPVTVTGGTGCRGEVSIASRRRPRFDCGTGAGSCAM